jgi:hypothetical protein
MAGQRDLRPLLPVVAVIALLVAGLIAAAFGNPSLEALPRQLVPTTAGPAPRESAAEDNAATGDVEAQTSRPPSRSPGPAALAFAAMVALLGAGLLVWWLNRGRAQAIQVTPAVRPAPPDHVRRLLWGAVDHGLEALAETDSDPRRAVIACWARLGSVAAEAGTVPRPGDTSTDLVLRLLAEHRVNGDVLDAFAGVYRQARFAAHVVDDSMRLQAQTALGQLRDEMALGAGRV